MTLQLEADHPAEVRAGDRRELDDLDHGVSPGDRDVDVPSPKPELPKPGAERRAGVAVDGDREGLEQAEAPRPPPERDHLQLLVVERETETVAHSATVGCGGAPGPLSLTGWSCT